MMSDWRGGTSPRILVILLGAIGDVVRGLSVINYIKRQLPQARITWLVEPASHGVVSLHRGIDEVVVFRRGGGARAAVEVWRELRKRRFDIALDMQRHLKSGVFSLLSRAPKRVGFDRADSKEFNWLFNNYSIPAGGEIRSKLEHYLEFVKALEIPLAGEVDAGLSHITVHSLRDELRGSLLEPYVVLILGSSRYSKDWPEEGYRGVIERLEPGLAKLIVLIGDRGRVQMAKRLAGAEGRVPVLNLVGETSLGEVVGILSGAEAVIGPDSGPGHIAAAVGTPHITLFGPTPSSRNAPRGSEDLSVVSALGCVPCRRRVCPGLDKLCMRLISPDAVLEKLQLALSRTSQKASSRERR